MPVYQDLRCGTWFFRFNYTGKMHFKGGFRLKDQAVKAEVVLKDSLIKSEYLPQSRGEDLTFSEAVDIWFTTNPLEKSTSSLTNERSRFALAKQFFENKRLKDISEDDVRAFLREMPKLRHDTKTRRVYKTVTLHTRNHYLALMKALWNRLRAKKKYSGENPCEGLEKVRVNEARTRYLLTSEEKILTPIVATSPDIYAYYFTALHTGCRIGELRGIKVQDVDLLLHRLFIGGRTKNKRSRYVPISEELAEFLRLKVEQRNPEDFVLPNWSYQFIHRNFEELVEKADLSDGLHLHDLRHTFAQRLLCAGVPIYKVSKILGHSSVVVTEKHYGHFSQGDLQDSIEGIKGVVSSKTPQPSHSESSLTDTIQIGLN